MSSSDAVACVGNDKSLLDGPRTPSRMYAAEESSPVSALSDNSNTKKRKQQRMKKMKCLALAREIIEFVNDMQSILTPSSQSSGTVSVA